MFISNSMNKAQLCIGIQNRKCEQTRSDKFVSKPVIKVEILL